MNSLPEDWQDSVQSKENSYAQEIAEKEQFDQEQMQAQKQLNQIDDLQVELNVTLQSGPIPLEKLIGILADEGMMQALARDASKNIPNKMSLIWDEGKKEGWLSFAKFTSDRQVDEWQAWLEASGLPARKLETQYVPLGDIYEFELGLSLHENSIEIARDESAQNMFQTMRSAEVLWFQAYQRINDQKVETTLNWSPTDSRYHLIVSGIANAAERQLIWSNLTAVGLLPSLAEE